MKSFFRFVLRALVLLVVALVSALTAMRFAIHGRETKVPDLVGKTPADARKVAEAGGFQMVIERQYFSATVPEGRILSQVPSAGTMTRGGWQLRVAQSMGPQRVQIPNVTGQSERAAELNIRRRGLDVSAVAAIAMPGGTADQVLAQSPPANASDVSAPKISLLTSLPNPPQAYVMPSFIGQTVGNATAVLKAAGFQVGHVTLAAAPANPASPENPAQPSPPQPPAQAVLQPSPASVIVAQNPPAGWKVPAGTAVSFDVR
jgi:eukaryotic-like serine/threonine-protein kinase